MQHVVIKPSRMKLLMGYEVPSDLYPSLLTEAIFQRSLQVISLYVCPSACLPACLSVCLSQRCVLREEIDSV